MTIRGEISKRPFPAELEEKHYESVSMQMGRVQLDADWNEAFETLIRARERVVRDVVGKQGSPNNGFRTDKVLVLDHMESKKGWSPLRGWEVDYFEKVEKFEGKGSFKITGNISLQRDIPLLLKELSNMQSILLKGRAVPGSPKLALWYKVSATENAKIQITLTGTEAEDISTPDVTYPCNGWQVLELGLSGKDLTAYETLRLNIDTIGIVNLGCLALDPGLVTDYFKDFYVQGGEGSSENAGRYYVDGMACVKEGYETYLTQKDYPEPAAIDALLFPRLVYLDVWKRTVTGVEAPDILEAALGGPDTCAREQLVSQVKVIPAASCVEDIARAVRSKIAGTLTAKLSPKAEQAKCDFRPELDYTGLNNSFYRIEIHKAGPAGSATFKWSRNNGADVVLITKFAESNSVIVPDDRLLCCGDVVELCDDVSDLADFADEEKHGKLATITDIEHMGEEGVKITLDFRIDNAIINSTSPFSDRTKQKPNSQDHLPRRHPKLRKWHGVENVGSYTELSEIKIPDLSTRGPIPLNHPKPPKFPGIDKAQGYAKSDENTGSEKELEHGIKLIFSEGSNTYYYHGDFWQFTARVNTRSIEELEAAPPMGPVHHYAPLSKVQKRGNTAFFNSCRKVFPSLTDLAASDIGFDAGSCDLINDPDVTNVQQAIEALCRMKGYDRIVMPGQSIQAAIDALGPEGGSIYLAPGMHIVTKTVLMPKEKSNITISGDGPATRIVYIPKETLREKIQELKAAIARENNEVRKKDLMIELESLERELALKMSTNARDLFRITGSKDIALQNFLMLSFGTDSLVAALDDARSISVSGCEIYNPARNEVASECIRVTDCCEISFDDNRVVGNIGFLQQGDPEVSMMPLVNGLQCVKNRFFVRQAGVVLIEGTRVVIQDNIVQAVDQGLCEYLEKIAGSIELIPNSGCFAETVQTIDGIITKIRESTFQCVPDPMTKENVAALGRAFVLRNSRIENNVFGGDKALVLAYSEENEISKNNIVSDASAALLVYSFRTNLSDNIFTSPSVPGSPAAVLPGPIPAPEPRPAPAPAPNAPAPGVPGPAQPAKPHTKDAEVQLREAALEERKLRMEEAVAVSIDSEVISRSDTSDVVAPRSTPGSPAPATPEKIRGEDGGATVISPVESAARDEKIVREKNDRVLIDRETIEIPGHIPSSRKMAVVMVHFADQFTFSNNEVTGATGLAVRSISKNDVIDMLMEFSRYWAVHRVNSVDLRAEVLLGKRFTQLMGLQPTIGLIEAVLKLSSRGEELDLVSLLVQSLIKNELPRKNVLLLLIVKLFEALLSLTVISRSAISRNRFVVEQYGIRKIQETTVAGNVPDISLTLGGVEIADNRIVGAEDTAIVWKSCALFANPDLNGVLLSCGYEGLLRALKLIQGVFKTIIEQAELKTEATPLNIFIATFAFYTVAQKCPQETTPAPETGEKEPENPYIGIIKEIIDLLGALIDQLEDATVRKNVSDLSRSADRISANRIRGKGNGIHTNIANCIIESNRIDVEPGTSAIAALFAMGRQFQAHAALIDHVNAINNKGQSIDHAAIAALGSALMNMNANALASAGEMLADEPGQWKDLGNMLEAIIGFVGSTSSITKGLHDSLAKLHDVVLTEKPQNTDIKTAAGGLIKEAQGHLTGYGIITESPGVHVVDNRIEAVMSCGSDTRSAPGGILMTGGDSGIVNMVTYFLLAEELLSLKKFNIGGQGTRFLNNSVQGGAGHGISLSGYPFLSDVSIENNEIQNHGLSGILCDRPALFASLSVPAISKQAIKANYAKTNALGMTGTTSPVAALLFLSYLYKLRITDNEINQCFLNNAIGYVPGQPSQTIYFKENNYSITVSPATILGGLMVRNAAELTCSRNTIRSCGTGGNPWPCSGSALINCFNVKYAENKILGNGKEAGTVVYQPDFPQGGALFLGPRGRLGITGNELSDNIGITALVIANYEIVALSELRLEKIQITVHSPVYESWALERLQVQGNDFEIDAGNLAGWAKIHMGNKELLDSIRTLNFTGNNIDLPATGNWYGVVLAADRLLFNNNAVTGVAEMPRISLTSNKGIGTGNILDQMPELAGIYLTEDPKNEHNRLQ